MSLPFPIAHFAQFVPASQVTGAASDIMFYGDTDPTTILITKKSWTEDIVTSETVSSVNDRLFTIGESASISEAWQLGTTPIPAVTGSVSDTILYGDPTNITAIRITKKTWGDTITTTESLSSVKNRGFTISESASLSETLQRTQNSLAPNAPSGLSASRQSNQAGVNLSWTDNSNDETAFVIERSTDGTNYTEIGTVGANVTSDTDWAGAPVTKPVISSIDSQNDDKIVVSWGAVSQATEYVIYRHTQKFVPGDTGTVTVATTSNLTYTITGLAQNTQYYVVVRGKNGTSAPFGEGAFAEAIAQTTGPTIPQNFSYSYNGSTGYNLSWTNGTRDDDSLIVERSTNGGGSWSQVATPSAGSTSYFHSNPTSGHLYRIKYNGETSYAT